MGSAGGSSGYIVWAAQDCAIDFGELTMVDKAACEKHEDAIQDKTNTDAKDSAGDLSSSCWQKPEKASATAANPASDTASTAPVPVGDSNGSGGSGLSRLGFPDTKFDLSAGTESKLGDIPQSQAERSQVGDQANNAQVNDAKNPLPETWKYDDKGNLLQAGDRVKASYDQQGNLQKVQIDDTTFERKGNDVVETYKGNDGEMHTHVNKDASSFSLTTEERDYKGAYKSVIVQAGRGHTLDSKVWESPEHTAAVEKVWRDERQHSIDVANSTPEHPHPDTWKRDASRNIVEAGNKFSAEYDPKTGELISAKLGDDEWRRGPDNTVIQTHTRKDGTTRTDTYTDVRSFTAEPYTDTQNGLLAGMTVSVGEGKTSESARSVPIYENEEHANWSNGIVNNWVAKAQSK